MNDRERFINTMRFKDIYRLPLVEWGYWVETIERWHKEGLPSDISFPNEYFGHDRWNNCSQPPPLEGNLTFTEAPIPRYEQRVIEEEEETQIVQREDGSVCRMAKRGVSMPQWLSYPVRDRRTWEDYKKRLNPDSPGRVRSGLTPEIIKRFQSRDYVLFLHPGGSLFGFMRNVVGPENLLYLFYDDPLFVHEMIEYFLEFSIACARKLLDKVKVDIVNFWEDMAMKNGPLISPKMFREFMLPSYKKLVQFYQGYGIELFSVDSDGDFSSLFPLFLESGVFIFHPIEIAAGMDPIELRKKYGKSIGLWGGIDKRALIAGKETIRQEVMAKVPQLIEKGGYVPFVDHAVPPDVSFSNYIYYQNCLREIFGMERIKI